MRWSPLCSGRSSRKTRTRISVTSCCRRRPSIFPRTSACGAKTTTLSKSFCRPGPSGTICSVTPRPASRSISRARVPRTSRKTSGSELSPPPLRSYPSHSSASGGGVGTRAAPKDTLYALSLGPGDGPRRYRSVVARDRHNAALFGGDGRGRHPDRRLLRPGITRPKALDHPAARGLCRDLSVHAAADPDRLVLLRSADPAEFLIAGVGGSGAGPDALHGCLLHRDLPCRCDVDRPRAVAGGPRARHDLCPADASDRIAAGRAPDGPATRQPIDHPAEEHCTALCRRGARPDVYELDHHRRDLSPPRGLHDRGGHLFHTAVSADIVYEKAGDAG